MLQDTTKFQNTNCWFFDKIVTVRVNQIVPCDHGAFSVSVEPVWPASPVSSTPVQRSVEHVWISAPLSTPFSSPYPQTSANKKAEKWHKKSE